MDFSSILNQVLGSVKDTMASNDTSSKITKAGGGAAAIGILSMILGRNGGSGLAKMGSLAVLGNLAYQAYQKYQQNQANAAPDESLPEEHFANAAQTAESGTAVLRTMIAAALCDGELDEQEKQAILAEAGQNPELQQWISQEVANPASVAEIAQTVGSDQALAAQVYLAARLVCGAELSRKEIVFLGQLAQALHLDDQLVEQLEKQAGF